ncbi:MAG TPA: polysaccharide biosynthesis/export family protein [Acidimicrobiia bacterium]|jgi:polysaccharide export outer membrane protein|nr:polysaccharide biosynthesis/export family protein [Acidimicrobiia bacterium]
MKALARFLVVFGVVASLGQFATGCADNPPATYPTIAPFDETQIPLGPADKIELVIYYGSHEIKADYVIDPAGDIEVQFIGRVPVQGKTAHTIQEDVKQRLADGYLIDPIVNITVAEINSQKLSVFGQVARSGSIKFAPGMTIVDAIADSGGFSPLARKNMVKVTRMLDGKPAIYKIPVESIAEGTRPNFPVMPGDQVFVPERAW